MTKPDTTPAKITTNDPWTLNNSGKTTPSDIRNLLVECRNILQEQVDWNVEIAEIMGPKNSVFMDASKIVTKINKVLLCGELSMLDAEVVE